MPDASGRFKGISVPAIPWHDELANPKTEPVRCGCLKVSCPYCDEYMRWQMTEERSDA